MDLNWGWGALPFYSSPIHRFQGDGHGLTFWVLPFSTLQLY